MNNLPGFVTRNFRLKVGCALLALVTWTGVVYAGNPPQTRIKSVPVPQQKSSIPAGFRLIHKVPDLQLRLGGTRDSLDSFDPSDLDINVNWKSVKKGGVQSVPITVVNNNPKVELLDAPSAVQANIDTVTSSVATVNIAITGNPPPGILVTGQAATPSSVAVSGPQHELSGLVARVDVDLSAEKANFQAQLDVHTYDPQGNRLGDVEINPSKVTVSITLSSSITSRIVAVEPHIVGKVSTGYVLSGVTYSPLILTLSGPQDVLNAIDSVSTSTISINGLTGNVTLSVPVQLPAGVTASSGLISVTILVTPVAQATPTPTPTPSPPAPTP